VVALNVPVVDGSTVDLTAETAVEATVEEVNSVVAQEVESRFQGVIEYVADPIVSSDVRLNSHSGVFDSLATMVTTGDLVKTITWFNNGWGYSHRALEATTTIAGYLEGGQ
jgi:glyceraldehyde 3-phosphate dehydrogenase